MPRNYRIYCEDCGHPRYASARNTRFCRTCRFLRDATFWQMSQRFRNCNCCGNEYFPFHSEHKLCHACSFVLPDERGTCALCKTEGAHLITDHKVCHRCATDPATRPRFLASLADRQAAQRAKHGDNRGRPAEDLRRPPADPTDREPAHV